MHTMRAPAFDHVLATGKGTIVVSLLTKVRVEDACKPLKQETPFCPYVPHSWAVPPVLVTGFHNRPPESEILVTLCTVDRGTLFLWESVRWATVVGLGLSAKALAEHTNGALAHWKVVVASRQAKKREATLMEHDRKSMDTDDTASWRLGHMRVPRLGKKQGQALTVEAVEALRGGKDSKSLTVLVRHDAPTGLRGMGAAAQQGALGVVQGVA